MAAQMGSLPLVHLFFRAGLSQKSLDYAFKTAIQTRTDHRVEKELVALGADFPADPDFLVTFTAAMNMAAKTIHTDNNLQETLSILFANVILAPLEVYEVLLAAISGRNLSAVAAISLAVVDDHEICFRLLSFLQLVGAAPDTPALRERLLQNAKSGNLKCLD
ncbi:hypothetical protein B0T18DRAFT_423388 [Schizothecium vesticola]|uniref:Uncharacterized protein n=1 Tax=Schizothecium vesticola TaxID=314040 RepID=A0AA40F7N3_9PEZI|nr:hypothetical protein B0T18DRAFT_423388 [Schizothecium vesticola]